MDRRLGAQWRAPPTLAIGWEGQPNVGGGGPNLLLQKLLFPKAIATAQLLVSGINIIQFLSLSFEGPAKWFFLGYIFYLILVVAIAVTAVFYNHLEVNLDKQIHGFRSMLAWIHLIGMNVGGAATTIAMISAGLIGSGMLDLMLNGGMADRTLQPNVEIMEHFITPIAAFAGLLSIGVIAGGVAYITTYLRKKK
jgi:uncharacterized membrane protein SirB2